MGIAEGNRRAWEIASHKYVVEADEFVRVAEAGTLLPVEIEVIGPTLRSDSLVVHLQSGNGTDDVALSRLVGSTVVGVDFSAVATAAAQARARFLGGSVAYVVADALHVPLAGQTVDLVYTGKGALMWLPDLAAWASEVARLLRPGGCVFLYEAHPMAALWDQDPHHVSVRPDRNYFGGTRPNDNFPASAIARFSPLTEVEAIEWQWSLADLVTAVICAGLQILHLGEYPEPFWRPTDATTVAAWTGVVPNSFSLLASKP